MMRIEKKKCYKCQRISAGSLHINAKFDDLGVAR